MGMCVDGPLYFLDCNLYHIYIKYCSNSNCAVQFGAHILKYMYVTHTVIQLNVVEQLLSSSVGALLITNS